MITRKEFLQRAGLAGLAGLAATVPWRSARAATGQRPPNVLWISTEDIGSHLGCYGDPNAITPALDRLATEGVRYSHFFTAAPVCAPNRSCIITGMYPQTIGSHPMRSGGEGADRSQIPPLTPPLRCFPQYLRDAGYYCTNNVKEDFNFVKPPGVWDDSSNKAHWRNRPNPDQPFFAVFNATVTHESANHVSPTVHAKRTAMLTDAQRQDPAKITPPPYHADTPRVRETWARYLETVTAMDYWVADLLQQLADDGLADNTIVMFWSDHGDGVPRCKRWCLDSGTRVPVIVRIPEAYRTAGQGLPGTTDNRLCSSIDFAPTVLHLAGLPIPGHLQGQPFLGNALPAPRAFVYAARDRMDERHDIIRSVRGRRFRYVRQYQPWLPYNQYLNYGERHPIQQEMRRLAAQGKLPSACAWFTAPHKAIEELYDSENDPHEMINLVDDPAHQSTLAALRAEHARWFFAVDDLGLIPEAELFDLDAEHGGRYNIARALKQADPNFFVKLRDLAMIAGRPEGDDVATLVAAMRSPYPSMRYWAVIGLGNLGAPGDTAKTAAGAALGDGKAVVRVAAAGALFRMGHAQDKALETLARALRSSHEWIRHQSTLMLDEIGESARPLLPQLRAALKDRENKYVVRVAQHTVNVLTGGTDEAP